ncbi:hypothetical protein BDZ45DRAFT_747164 [Acephala macrosclerotiorum]|nr:hypothetical protein BDZ45DRAFT_747164 [Acephala macrosclerotiorum]
MSIERSIWQSMRVYRVSNTKDPRALSSRREVQVSWRTGMYCQHFFVRGPGAQYFEVRAEESSLAISSGDVDLDAAKTALKQAMQQAEEEARRQITEPKEAREPNPWLRRVEWVEHLRAFDRKELRELVAPVKDDKPKLEVLYKAFD